MAAFMLIAMLCLAAGDRIKHDVNFREATRGGVEQHGIAGEGAFSSPAQLSQSTTRQGQPPAWKALSTLLLMANPSSAWSQVEEPGVLDNLDVPQYGFDEPASLFGDVSKEHNDVRLSGSAFDALQQIVQDGKFSGESVAQQLEELRTDPVMQALAKTIAEDIQEMHANPESEGAAKRIQERMAAMMAMMEDPVLGEKLTLFGKSIMEQMEELGKYLQSDPALVEHFQEMANNPEGMKQLMQKIMGSSVPQQSSFAEVQSSAQRVLAETFANPSRDQKA